MFAALKRFDLWLGTLIFGKQGTGLVADTALDGELQAVHVRNGKILKRVNT